MKLDITQTNCRGTEQLHAFMDKNRDKSLKMRWCLKFGAVTTTFLVHDGLRDPGKRIVHESSSLSDAIVIYNSI